MDYNLEYHKELERKMNMCYDNISTNTEETQRNKESIIRLNYKLNMVIVITLFTALLNVPQSIPFITSGIKLVLSIL